MLSNQAVISNTFQPNKPIFEHFPKKITGYDLERVIELSPFPSRVGRLLKFACNLAASTSEFVIYKAQKTLAADAGCSLSTLQRAYRVAVKMGVLSVTPVYCEKTRAQKANLYRFTAKTLSYVHDCLSLLKAAKLKVSSSQKAVRSVIAKAYALFDFAVTAPCQNEPTPACQNDAQEVRVISKTRKKLLAEPHRKNEVNSKVKNQFARKTTQAEVIESLAAAKSRADNERIAEKHDAQRSLLDKLLSKVRKQPQPRRSRTLPGEDRVPDYSFVPHGFRGA